MFFEEAMAMSFDDLDAIPQFGWRVWSTLRLEFEALLSRALSVSVEVQFCLLNSMEVVLPGQKYDSAMPAR